MELRHKLAMRQEYRKPLLCRHACDFLGQATSGSFGQLRSHVAM